MHWSSQGPQQFKSLTIVAKKKDKCERDVHCERIRDRMRQRSKQRQADRPPLAIRSKLQSWINCLVHISSSSVQCKTQDTNVEAQKAQNEVILIASATIKTNDNI